MKTIKIGKHIEYHEPITYSCGHIITTITLDYKLPRYTVRELKEKTCPACRHRTLLFSI
jgi:hypothetical protein